MSIDAKYPIWNESKFEDYHMSSDFVCLFFIDWKNLVVFVILNGLIKDIDWPNYISLLTFDYGTSNEKIRVLDIFVMPSKGMSGQIVSSCLKKSKKLEISKPKRVLGSSSRLALYLLLFHLMIECSWTLASSNHVGCQTNSFFSNIYSTKIRLLNSSE